MHKAIGCRVNVIYYSIIDAPLASVGEFEKGRRKSQEPMIGKLHEVIYCECLH